MFRLHRSIFLYSDGAVPGHQLDYEVTVVTGDVSYAGTDAHVYVQMYGTSGITQEVELDDEKDNFERNQTDVFKVGKVNLRQLSSAWPCSV